MKDILTIIVAVGLGIFIGYYFFGRKPVLLIGADLTVVKQERDSLQALTDTLYSRLDRQFVENSQKEIKETIKYITKIKKVEIETYFKMDTAGRVQHFHDWLNDSTDRFVANRSLEATRDN